MDCYRAQHALEEGRRAAGRELAAVVAVGRARRRRAASCYAGALADQGRIDEALDAAAQARPIASEARTTTTCASGTRSPTSRSGPATSRRARELFDRVRRADPGFADVAERRAALG